MSTRDNLATMRQTAGDLLDDFLLLYDKHLVRDGDRAWLPYGSLPPLERLEVSGETPPSSRLTCDVALGYLAAHIERGDPERLETALALLRHAFTRQHANGCFVWNYGQREVDNVDLGTVLDTYGWFRGLVPDLPADIRGGIEESTRRAIGYLKTMHQPDYSGIIRKRAADPDHPEGRRSADYTKIDVLNGNALAATAYCRAAEILDDASLADRAAMFQGNLVEGLGRHVPGWWAYVEWLGSREMMTPETILYQAMTALYLEPLWRAKPNDELEKLLADALETLATVSDDEGRLDWSHEARQDFVESQLLMLPAAAAALADVHDITGVGRRRLDFVAATLYDRDAHWFIDEVGEVKHGQPADELRQIWATSDLALIILHSRRQVDGVSPR
jgi:hypothetical protein